MHPLRDPVFRKLFAAQVTSLLGIGILTVALALTAYRFGGTAAAGLILGGLFALKMVAYVGLAPVAEVALSRVAPGRALVLLDVLRLGLVLPMAFATSMGQIALLAFLFYAASAAFTPLFQATIPDILPDEAQYTKALALSRLAYTFESILSPALTGLALTVISPPLLYPLAALCFALSATALALARIPGRAPSTVKAKTPFLTRLGTGMNIYLRTPRLRGLFLFNLALALGLSWVLVNTVVFAGLRLGDAGRGYPTLMASYGLGAAIAAICVPRLLRRINERRLMAIGGLLFGLLSCLILLPLVEPGLVLLWAGFGAASSLVLTPGGLVLTKSATRADRPALFAAQFSLSHAGWLLAYPLAGWLGTVIRPELALAVLGVACAATTLVALKVWPADDPLERMHSHPDLPGDHPHLRDIHADGSHHTHLHAFHIDDHHPTWAR
ncbi:MFS transporter [Pseudoruegeria sp. SK021]|uniref:MFS transporter n=1 Tax=Pseudoruegeria sp. SK021 TaxID=1933035 RepID=UPI0026B67AC5